MLSSTTFLFSGIMAAWLSSTGWWWCSARPPVCSAWSPDCSAWPLPLGALPSLLDVNDCKLLYLSWNETHLATALGIVRGCLVVGGVLELVCSHMPSWPPVWNLGLVVQLGHHLFCPPDLFLQLFPGRQVQFVQLGHVLGWHPSLVVQLGLHFGGHFGLSVQLGHLLLAVGVLQL